MSQIESLLRERAGYVARGLTDRVRQVDEQLSLEGYETADAPPPAERAVARRKARG